ncbi:MAG TPA: hypothetical protein VD902_22110, partial [Symbiobacteriaceae bacterium]|nr:hypothetical protein [Symbiobacteriaceae bacterium]
QALPGTDWPGNNAVKFPLPDIRNRYREMYGSQANLEKFCDFQWEPPDKVCPGIPPDLAPILDRYGFDKTRDKNGYWRFLLDTGLKYDQALGTWAGSSLPSPGTQGNFYGTHWGEGMENNHSTGGILRIVLGWLDYVLTAPAEATLSRDGTVVVNTTLRLDGQVIRPSRKEQKEKAVMPQFAWRPKGSTEWRPASAAFDTPVDSWTAWSAVTATLSFALAPDELSLQEIEVKVNPDETIAELTPTQPGTTTPTHRIDAYANNIATVRLRPARPNLQIGYIWTDGEPVVGSEMFANVAVWQDTSAGFTEPITIHKLTWTADGQTHTVEPNVTVHAVGDGVRIPLGTFTVKTAGAIQIEATVNPDHDQPPDETRWDDNTTVLDVETRASVDLEVVRVQAPGTLAYDPDGEYQVTWQIRNNSPVTVKATRTVSMVSDHAGALPDLYAVITLGPDESVTQSTRVPIVACGDRMRVTVRVTAAQGYTEENLGNNVRQATTVITGDCGGGPGGGGDGTMTVMVPADCVPNPDPESNRPCTNYDLTIPDWP